MRLCASTPAHQVDKRVRSGIGRTYFVGQHNRQRTRPTRRYTAEHNRTKNNALSLTCPDSVRELLGQHATRRRAPPREAVTCSAQVTQAMRLRLGCVVAARNNELALMKGLQGQPQLSLFDTVTDKGVNSAAHVTPGVSLVSAQAT